MVAKSVIIAGLMMATGANAQAVDSAIATIPSTDATEIVAEESKDTTVEVSAEEVAVINSTTSQYVQDFFKTNLRSQITPKNLAILTSALVGAGVVYVANGGSLGSWTDNILPESVKNFNIVFPSFPTMELPSLPTIELPSLPTIELPSLPTIELPTLPDMSESVASIKDSIASMMQFPSFSFSTETATDATDATDAAAALFNQEVSELHTQWFNDAKAAFDTLRDQWRFGKYLSTIWNRGAVQVIPMSADAIDSIISNARPTGPTELHTEALATFAESLKERLTTLAASTVIPQA